MRNLIPSPFMNALRASDAWLKPLAADAVSPDALHPAWQKVAEKAKPPGDRVSDAPEREPPFHYRIDSALLDRLPERAAALVRKLNVLATDARDRTVALSRHVDAARDRVALAQIDLAAAFRAASRADLSSVEEAKRALASENTAEAKRGYAASIVAAAKRLDDAEAEVRDLAERLREHNERTAPLIALRQRLIEAAARLRPPVKALDLREVPSSRASKILAEARRDIEAARAEIARLEASGLHPDDAPGLVAEAVRHHAERATPHRFVIVDNGRVTIREPNPNLRADDEALIAPLALLCAAFPDAITAWLASALPTDADAPRAADRLRLIDEARAKLRQAELTERACLAAMGDDPPSFRSDADPLITLAVEASR